MRHSSVPPSRLFIQDRFYKGAGQLRRHFDEVLGSPRGADPRRFCWDFWHVPNQYRLLRTPAYHFFPKAMYEAFHQRLALWGRDLLGCHDISPPWMSAYVDGCSQNFHADLPHGPWAFVFSLTPSARGFRGGETLLLRDEVLSFWEQPSLGGETGLEEREVLEAIPPDFNRLVVFDPRIPHGVSPVQGALDPLSGRLVIHGWFVQPRPFIRGKLTEKQLMSQIDRVLSALDFLFRRPEVSGVPFSGMASLRFKVNSGGRVSSLKLLAHSLRASAQAPRLTEQVLGTILHELSRARFDARAEGSVVTLPLTFG